jgi:phosphoribosylformylglycinamidine (FGAM) synthase-like enzyme
MPISANSSKSLDRIPRANPSKNPTDTAKTNYDAVRYGNNHGSISFGHIHKEGDVTSSVAPGNFQVECGSANEQSQDSLILNAKNGNIVIVATNGKIRMEADDIEFVARGSDGSQGNIKMTATENFYLDAKKVLINAKSFIKIASPGTCEICAHSVLKIYGSMIRGLSDACGKKDSKVGGKRFQQECVKV